VNAAAAVCDWLATIFAAPVRLERLMAWRSAEGGAALRGLGAQAGIGPEMTTTLDALGDDTAAIEAAHHALFSGAAGPRTVAPYESPHVAANGLLWQEPAAAMRHLLEQHDVRPAGVLEHEPPDHLATELALLAELLRRRETPACAHLLQAHLLGWLPDFADACTAHDTQGFHAAAARTAERLTVLLHRQSEPEQADELEEART
jgi:TorA maturation chaperone TorD